MEGTIIADLDSSKRKLLLTNKLPGIRQHAEKNNTLRWVFHYEQQDPFTIVIDDRGLSFQREIGKSGRWRVGLICTFFMCIQKMSGEKMTFLEDLTCNVFSTHITAIKALQMGPARPNFQRELKEFNQRSTWYRYRVTVRKVCQYGHVTYGTPKGPRLMMMVII